MSFCTISIFSFVEKYFLYFFSFSAAPQRTTCSITINQPADYMARAFMILMRSKDNTGAIGRVGLKIDPVLGPEIA